MISGVITITTTTTTTTTITTTTYHPVNVEAEDGGNEKDKPQQWTEEEGGPEDGRIAAGGSIRLGAALLLLRLTEEHKLGVGLSLGSAWTGSSASGSAGGRGHGRPILEHPVTLALVVDVVPPAEADQQAAGDVLHHPEVGGDEEDEGDEEAEKLAAEGAAEQVDDHGADLEDEVEEDGHRVSECFLSTKRSNH